MDADAYYAQVVDRYSRYVNPGLARLLAFAGFGVEMRGEGCYLYDHDGRQFLDCLGGYGTFALGHCHPRVVEAVQKQAGTMGMSGKAFFSGNLCELAEMLAEVTPDGLQYSFFNSSGAEAVEAALKFAKVATGRSRIISTNGGYHGKTLGALATTGREKYRKRAEPLMPGVVFVDFGDTEAMVNAINGETAAVIIEPIQGEGGIHIPPAGYLRAIRGACDRNGALMIADEVQTGLGRTGLWFGVNVDDVTPDIMTLAKQLGGGVMPLGATIGTPAVWEAVFSENPLMHTSTFGGSPIACAAGIATLKVIQDDGLVERSAVIGARMLEGLQGVAARHSDMIVEARGRGLMIGVEFQMDEVGELTVSQMLKRGLSAAYTLNNPRVMRFEPPLIISEEQVDWAVETFEASIVETKELLAELVGV
jgi:putrescine aminotransferase